MYVAASDEASVADLAISALLLLVLLGLQLLAIGSPSASEHPTRRALAVGALALIVIIPIAPFHVSWLGLLGFLAGGVLLAAQGRLRWYGWALFVAILLGAGALAYLYERGYLDAIYFVVLTAVFGLTIYGLSRLVEFVGNLQVARAEIAELAVAQERLRLAGDLNELLGERLSAISLRCELAKRLMDRHARYAHAELASILDLARRALADVRAAARSYREVSLHGDIASARATLASAGVAVSVHVDEVDIDPDTGAALVRALRTGIDNVLRHSRPRSCVVKVTRSRSTVGLEVLNDGAVDPSSSDRRTGGALEQIATRFAKMGGSVQAGSIGRGFYRLRAELPLPAEQVRGPCSDLPNRLQHWVRALRHRQADEPSSPMDPGFARVILVFVVVGCGIDAVALIPQLGSPMAGTAAAAVCVVGMVFLQLSYFSPARRPLGRRRRLVLFAQVLLVFAPTVVFGGRLLTLPGFAGASALLVLEAPASFLVLGLLVSAAAGTEILLQASAVLIGYGVISTINLALVVYSLTRLRSLMAELHEAHADLALAAATQERLRFARDLHDLLGYSLSAITLKIELAGRTVGVDPCRARTELAEVMAITRSALDDERAVAGTYRNLALCDELASVTSVLATADIEVEVRDAGPDPPAPVAAVLATVLRESVTNILRHSEASTCVITLDAAEHEVTMVVENDGVCETTAATAGTGIVNLTERLQAVSGTLQTARLPGQRYQICARIPMTPPSPASGGASPRSD